MATKGKNQKKKPVTQGELVSKPVITVDVDEFAHFLDDADMTDEEKVLFLQTYWNLFVEITSIGWGVHPVQLALQAKETSCGKPSNTSLEAGTDSDDAVYCLDRKFFEKFDAAAGLETDREEKGVGP